MGVLWWWWDFFNITNGLFVRYDGVGSGKCNVSGAVHIDQGKSFLGYNHFYHLKITWLLSWYFVGYCEVSHSASFSTTSFASVYHTKLFGISCAEILVKKEERNWSVPPITNPWMVLWCFHFDVCFATGPTFPAGKTSSKSKHLTHFGRLLDFI